jgi:hypothetical protein
MWRGNGPGVVHETSAYAAEWRHHMEACAVRAACLLAWRGKIAHACREAACA